MSLTFKRLSDGDYTVSEFRTSRTVDIDFDRSVGADEIQVMDGVRKQPPFLPAQYESAAERNSNGTYKKMVYDLVRHMYYAGRTDYDRFGVESYQDIILDHFEGSDGRITVVKVSPRTYGERIKPGSVRFGFTPTGGDVTDDGAGNLVASSGQVVGNVFYSHGIIVFTRRGAEGADDVFTFFPGYADYTATDGVDFNGFSAFRLRFDNKVTHFENEVKCEVLPHEFTWTENPSVLREDDTPTEYGRSEDFRPYITTVGLYDDQNNLVAVGKLDRPVRKPRSVPLTVSVQFDT